jgi:hypothetical protein
MARSEASDQCVDLLGTVQVLHKYLTASVCQTVFEQTRTTERARKWTLAALAEFWTAVILRAPPSLTQALEEAATSPGAGWPSVQASPEAFFERCQNLHWRFFAKLYEAFVDHVLPDARPCYAQPLQALRQHFPDVWVVDGSRLDAVAHRLKLLRDVRACVGRRTAADACRPGARPPRNAAGWGSLVRGGEVLCGLESPRPRRAVSA